MIMDDLQIYSPLDIPTPTNTEEAVEAGLWIYERAMTDGAPDIAAQAFNQIFSFAQFGSIALSVATYNLQRGWKNFDLDVDFFDWASQMTGKHRHTFERYWRVGKLLDEKPEKSEILAEKNIGEIIPIAAAHEQGYEITEDHWKSLQMAGNEAEIRQIIREEIRETEPRRVALILSIDNDGTIWASRDGQVEIVGALSVSNDSEIAQQAIARIKNKSGMLTR